MASKAKPPPLKGAAPATKGKVKPKGEAGAGKSTPRSTPPAETSKAAAPKPSGARTNQAAPKTAAVLKPISGPAAAPPRFRFEAMPVVRDAAGLSPLLRQQLVWDARLSSGRATTPDRIPASCFNPGIIRWRVTEKGKPLLDIVHNIAFFAGTDEPAGLERRGGMWVATGRGTTRGLALDLESTAWDLNHDWPGRRLPLPPEPKRGGRVKPELLSDGEPFPTGTIFV